MPLDRVLLHAVFRPRGVRVHADRGLAAVQGAKLMTATSTIMRAVVLALALASTPDIAQAQTPEEFYRGKTINLIIPNAPGGSFDLYARLVASHLGRFIPGNPSIVPQNMPGA